MKRALAISLAVLAGWNGAARGNTAAPGAPPYGLETRPPSRPFLSMPATSDEPIPRLLSQTGAFGSLRDLRPAEGLIPFEVKCSFWSDGAAKSRWISVPSAGGPEATTIGFRADGEWKFPPGTVFVKHFEVATNDTRPELRKRLETRLLVCDRRGGVYGVTYKWRGDNSDADLLVTNLAERFLVQTAGGIRTQTWYYPSRQDCQTCHTERAGGALGVKTRQLNGDCLYPNGRTDNQLRAWNHIGLFAPAISEADISRYPRLASQTNLTRSVEERARSYLDANCANCHRPGGTVAFFDARYDTPLAQQGLINGDVLFNQGIDHARVIAPNDPWRSIALLRVESPSGDKMPPLAHNVLDRNGAALLREWIGSLEGKPVLPPPGITPAGGRYKGDLEVRLSHANPEVSIHYTLDGSVPGASDPLYTGPIKLTGPTTLRAKAFKAGYTRSVTAQETFQVEE